MKVEVIDKYENESLTSKIKKIIKEKAKFQKVMLLFDSTANSSILTSIYEEIKDYCIFNKTEINSENLNEIYNGYKMIIFVGSANSYLSSKIRISEFSAIFLPTDEYVLPYFLDETNKISNKDNNLFLKRTTLDITLFTSVYFNRFFNFINDLLYTQTSSIDFCFNIGDITQKNMLNTLSSAQTNWNFIDLEIVKTCNIDIKDLCLVDFILISAFYSMINSIKLKTYELVDVYKATKDNYGLIDRYYAMANNELISSLLFLNYNKLQSSCVNTKNVILELIDFISINKGKIDDIINKIKTFCKFNDGLLGYLYLYNIFDV